MKLRIGLITFLAIITVGLFYYTQTEPSNTTIEDVKNETKDLLDTIGNYTADKKDEAVLDAKQGLASIDTRLETLEATIDEKWSEMSNTARSEAREKLEALQVQRNQVAQWYDSMKTSSENSWEHIKTGFSESFQALEESWEKTEQEFTDE